MLQIQNLTSDAKQQQNLILGDGTIVNLSLYYSAIQQGWFITNLTYGTFVLNGVRITNSPDILYQFKNQLPFGLACFSIAGREPTQQQDFLSGEAVLYILTQAEVEAYTAFLQASNG